MAKLRKSFNPNKVDTTSNSGGDLKPLPDGIYDAKVHSTDYKATAKGNGHYIEVVFEVTGPTNAGRRVWEMYVIDHSDDAVVERAERDLARFLNSIGFEGDLEDTDDVLGLTCKLKLKTEAASDGYEARNRVKWYEALDLDAIERNKSLIARRASSGGAADFDDDDIPF